MEMYTKHDLWPTLAVSRRRSKILFFSWRSDENGPTLAWFERLREPQRLLDMIDCAATTDFRLQ
jgi:hypothetical protein